MKKIVLVAVSAAAMLLVFITGILTGGCSPNREEGFAIYLTEGDIAPEDISSLLGVKITDKPIIGAGDIVAYNMQTHEMKLTAEAFARLKALQVPVYGTSFIVCAGRQPVYQGAFWTPVSSISYNGVTIWKPYDVDTKPVIALSLGYPGASFYSGEDPRNNARLMFVLERDGKLISKYTIQDIESLPRSMKGYELYSWQAGEAWHFTLITGTNRNKSPDEVTSGEDYISEVGFIKISVTDVKNLEAVVSKIPAKESVSWLADLRAEENPATIQFGLPPEETVQAVKGWAVKYGIDLIVEGYW
jgi:hypothetical protein